MDFYVPPEQDVSPEVIADIETFSHEYNLEWPIEYKYGGNFPASDEKTAALILDAMSHAGIRDHIFVVNENPEAIINPEGLMIIAQAKLAETCSILSSLPPIYVFDEGWYEKSAPINYLHGYLSIFEKTSLIWAADLVEMHHPLYLDTYIANGANRVRRVMHDLHQSGKLKDLELYKTLSSAVIAKVLADRITVIESSVKTSVEAADSLLIELENLIPAEYKEWFNHTKETIYDNYADLPQAPLDGDQAAIIVQERTLLHAATTPLTMHPILMKNLKVDDDEIIPGHFWTINGNLFAEEIDIQDLETANQPMDQESLLRQIAPHYNPN